MAWVFFVALAAMLAVVPLWDWLSEELWAAAWKHRMSKLVWATPWTPAQFVNYPDDPAVLWLVRLYQFALPAFLLLVAMRCRLKPIVAFALSPLSLILFLALVLEWFNSSAIHEELLTVLLLGCAFNGFACGVAAAISRDDDSEVEFDVSQDDATTRTVTTGIAQRPWRTWLILVLAYFGMVVSLKPAEYLNDYLWEWVEVYDSSLRWSEHKKYLDAGDWNHEMFRYSIMAICGYVLPFVFLVVAIRCRMRSWFGWVFGLLTAFCLGLFVWLLETTYHFYKDLSQAVIAGQLFGFISVMALCAFHHQVSRIHFRADHEMNY